MAAARCSYYPTSFRRSGDRATMATTTNDDDDDDDDGDIVVWEEARAVVTSSCMFVFLLNASDIIEALN